jgi:putative copper export protein
LSLNKVRCISLEATAVAAAAGSLRITQNAEDATWHRCTALQFTTLKYYTFGCVWRWTRILTICCAVVALPKIFSMSFESFATSKAEF